MKTLLIFAAMLLGSYAVICGAMLTVDAISSLRHRPPPAGGACISPDIDLGCDTAALRLYLYSKGECLEYPHDAHTAHLH